MTLMSYEQSKGMQILACFQERNLTIHPPFMELKMLYIVHNGGRWRGTTIQGYPSVIVTELMSTSL